MKAHRVFTCLSRAKYSLGLQYLIRQPHLFAVLPWFTDTRHFLIASCTILYSFEGQALVLPMENAMKKKSQILGPIGVLSQGMTIVTVAYTSMAFLGFSTYGASAVCSLQLVYLPFIAGAEVAASITLNLPPSA